MSGTYRDRYELAGFAIEISIVDEDGGAHVTVWPEFDDYNEYPPGLKEAIAAWCKTRAAQDWALAQEAREKAARPKPEETPW